VRDHRGPFLHDRFRADGGAGDAGARFVEDYPYFGSFAVVADAGLGAFAAAAGRVLRDSDGARRRRRGAPATRGARPLPRRECARLTALFEALWAAARREILGLPALALRKP